MKALQDIEDLPKVCTGNNNGGTCHKTFIESLHLKFKDGSEWHKVYAIIEILQILKQSTLSPYILLAGNTGHGEHFEFICAPSTSKLIIM